MTKEALRDILQARYDREQWKKCLLALFGAHRMQVYSQPQPKELKGAGQELAQSVCRWGEVRLDDCDDSEALQLYEVVLRDGIQIERSRVKVNQLIADHVRTSSSPNVLVSFSHAPTATNTKWRLSFVGSTEHYNEAGELVEQQTQAKRYTYVLGTPDTHKTAIDRLLGLNPDALGLGDLFKAFSVEKLSSDFFKEYKLHYEAFVADLIANEQSRREFREHLFWNKKVNEKVMQKAMRDFCKKLMGRIIFLYFIQKKGWLGVDTPEDYAQGLGKPDFMQVYFAQVKEKGEAEDFYTSYLSALFFDVLNNPNISHQPFVMPNRSLCYLPYLNGGLFEAKGHDIMDVNFSPELFENFFAFLERYNFTVVEDHLDEQEVAVDPEMLGNIFENLLEDNKDKGTFYTPKAIVSYMTQESLLQYLHTHLPQAPPNALEELVRHKKQGNSEDYFEKHKLQIITLLDKVTICDPAIGSGAFPMGILHEILEIKLTLNWTLDRAEEKKKILQNNIYGVDIEQGAIDIARLRFWLSIIIEQDVPTPLPNLDYKIMQGNSLLQSFEGIDLSFKEANTNAQGQGILYEGMDAKKQEKLEDLVHKFFKTADAFFKNKYRTHINNIIQRHIKDKFNQAENYWTSKRAKAVAKLMASRPSEKASVALQKKNEKAYAKAQKEEQAAIKGLAEVQDKQKRVEELYQYVRHDKPYFIWRLFFKEVFAAGGFDIVIGNPPYIQLQKIKEQAALLAQEGYQTFSKSADIYCLFYEKGFELLKPKGVLSFITSNKWMRARYGKEMRKYFLEKTALIELIDFGDASLFETATTYTNILLASKQTVLMQKPKVFDLSKNLKPNLELRENLEANKDFVADFSEEYFLTPSYGFSMISQAMKKKGVLLKNWNLSINYGIKTGFNEAFIIDKETKDKLITTNSKNKEVIKPMLIGRNIKRYSIDFQDLWLINTHNGIKEDNIQPIDVKKDYPEIYSYLKQFEKELTKRYDKGAHWTNLRNCAYLKDFEKPKIIFPNLQAQNKFTYDDQGMYINAPAVFVPTEDKSLLAILNSKLIWYFLTNIAVVRNGGFIEVKPQFFEQIPIPQIPQADQAPFEAKVDAIMAAKAAGQDSSALEAEVDMMVYRLYGLGYAEVKIVDPDFGLSEAAYREG